MPETTGAEITSSAPPSSTSRPPSAALPPAAPTSAQSSGQPGSFHLRGATGRLALSLLVGVIVGFVLSDRQSWATSIVGGWDCGSFTLLALNWQIVWTSDAGETKRRAGARDPGRTVAWLIALTASAFSLFAGSVVLRHAPNIDPERSPLLVALCLVAVGTAWSLTHTAYTLRYAHLYYRENDNEGGLVFPGRAEPDDFDFAYFAFTIGMAFQVSDVTITSSQIRRTVLGHAMLSFAYNTVIIALVINMLLGVFS